MRNQKPASNSWINRARGIWNYNGVSQADVANAYKTGDFSKVGNYLSQHRDLASYLNNVYSKRGGNQFNSSTNPTKQATPIQGTPGYGIHVGNNGVTLSTPNGQTTDITNSHNVSTLINNGNYKAPNLGSIPTNQLENRPLNSYSKLTEHNFNRSDVRQGMRANGINPYDYSGSDRKQLRTYLNNPTTDNYTQSVGKIVEDSKIQQNMLNNAVQNQTSKYQLTKPNLPNLGYDPSQNNQLVSLKFKQGGQMFKYQQGAQMVQPQQTSEQQGIEQQAMALVQAAMQGDKQANQTIQQIMQAAKQGDQQAVQVAKLLQAIVQQMQGSRKARLGAKLNYFKQVSECPEDQEVVYFKKGGEICKVCAGKKMQNGGKSDPIKEFKKKRVNKHQQGGTFKQAFNNAYGKQRYFTWNGKVYAAYKGDKATDQGFQGAIDNLQEQANALKDYGAGSHLGWNPGANKTTAIKHNNNGNMQGVVNDVVITGKRLPKRSQNAVRNKSNGWTTTAGQSKMASLAAGQQRLNEASKNGYGMGGSTNAFERMAVTEHGVLKGGDWRKDIKTWRDPRTGKSYQYITVDGINYLNNGRYWNPTTKRGGNYTWKPGWSIFGGGFRRN